MLTKSPLLKLYISDSKYFLKLWLFTMGWKTVFFGVCVCVCVSNQLEIVFTFKNYNKKVAKHLY